MPDSADTAAPPPPEEGTEVLILSTAKSPTFIIARGGSQSWILNPLRMRHVRYVICAGRDTRGTGGSEVTPGQAFLVAKVAGIRAVTNDGARSRYFIKFSDYALVAIDHFWSHRRIGPRYADRAKAKAMGLDIEALTFQPMPPPLVEPEGYDLRLPGNRKL